MKKIDVIINGKLAGKCDSAGKGSYPLFKDYIDPWIEIKGFVAPTPSLSDNQQVVLEWLKNQHFDSYIKSVLSNLYFYVNLTAVGDLESKEITAMVAAYKKLSQQEFAQVLQAYANWALEQEEKQHG